MRATCQMCCILRPLISFFIVTIRFYYISTNAIQYSQKQTQINVKLQAQVGKYAHYSLSISPLASLNLSSADLCMQNWNVVVVFGLVEIASDGFAQIVLFREIHSAPFCSTFATPSGFK